MSRVYLAAAVNLLASLLAALTLLTYLFLYTPLKRKPSLCVFVGAFPGAMPPLIGWAAASGHLPLQAWTLYTLLFLWQFPHFMAIASMYREDYERAGYLVLPHDGGARARFVTVEQAFTESIGAAATPQSIAIVRFVRTTPSLRIRNQLKYARLEQMLADALMERVKDEQGRLRASLLAVIMIRALRLVSEDNPSKEKNQSRTHRIYEKDFPDFVGGTARIC